MRGTEKTATVRLAKAEANVTGGSFILDSAAAPMCLGAPVAESTPLRNVATAFVEIDRPRGATVKSRMSYVDD